MPCIVPKLIVYFDWVYLGILEKFNDIKEGDIFEFYITEEYKD